MEKTVIYPTHDTAGVGTLCFPSKKKAPAILVAHAWRGKDAFAIETARRLANLGYVGFAIDLYGDGKTAESDPEAANLMAPLFLDRALLRKRIGAAFDFLSEQDGVDASAIGAIGFCFGGLSVLELLKSGKKVKGTATFHAVLGERLGSLRARLEPISKKASGSLLVLHGHDDPLVTSEDLTKLENDMTEANIDWQIHIFGRTQHAFTNPLAHDSDGGLQYNERSAKRSWKLMETFFEEIFNPA